jgi:hypothetical protein
LAQISNPCLFLLRASNGGLPIFGHFAGFDNASPLASIRISPAAPQGQNAQGLYAPLKIATPESTMRSLTASRRTPTPIRTAIETDIFAEAYTVLFIPSKTFELLTEPLG